MLFLKFGNPLILPQELQGGGDVRREKSSGRSVMGIYSWVGAWNLNRGWHCSGQVLRGGQTDCMWGKSRGSLGEEEGNCMGGNSFFWNCYCCCIVCMTGRWDRVKQGVPVTATKDDFHWLITTILINNWYFKLLVMKYLNVLWFMWTTVVKYQIDCICYYIIDGNKKLQIFTFKNFLICSQ